MGRGIILYQSKYGATEKYAKWLQEQTSYDIAETKKARAETAAGYHGGYGAAICSAAIFRESIPYGLAHVPVKP